MPIPRVDPDRPPSRLKRALMPFAMSRAGTWYGINVASRVDGPLMRLTGGRFNLGGVVLPTLLLRVRGRRSGIERTVPLVYFSDGDDLVLMASSFGRPSLPAWYHNLRANPDVTVTAGGCTERRRAREVHGAERDTLYEKAKRVYEGYGLYERKTAGIRPVPVIRLEPSEPAP